MNTNDRDLDDIFLAGEALTVEFKSDLKPLPDRELVAAVVALANTEGGSLFLGVEDDGTVTGLHANHRDPIGLSALVANRTNPPISLCVQLLEYKGKQVALLLVPKSRQLVSTTEGLLQRRRLLANGKPEAVPFYPHEFIQRQSSLGLIDPSAAPLTALSVDDLNPLERLRIREAIRRYGGDSSLLSLADEELDGALGLVTTVEGVRRPTVAGLLMLGREEILRRYVPAHEVAFQVMEGTDVRVNEFFRKPLLQTFEEIEMLFKARVDEQEIQVGLFRVPIPNYDRRAFREGLINALTHRDYSRLGAVHVRLDNDGLTLFSPLEKLVEANIVEAHSTGRGRTYTLSAKVYSNAGQKAAYVRQAGFDPIQREQMVLAYIDTHGAIKRAEAAELCRISPFQATRLLKRLTETGKVNTSGQGKGAIYERRS